MRVIISVLGLSLAVAAVWPIGTAYAQIAPPAYPLPAYPLIDHEAAIAQAEQRMARDRAIALENEWRARASDAQTAAALERLRRQSAPVILPQPLPTESLSAPEAEAFPIIPAERLAASRKRVLEITGGRR